MILKLQQGGNALPPLVSYQPVTVTGGATAGASVAAPSNNQETTDLTDKDVLKALERLKGLRSDTLALTQKLQNFYIDQQYSPFPNTSNIALRYIQTLGEISNINSNKELFDKVFDTAVNNGSIDEFAISDRGQLYCMNNKGDFKLLTLEQLKENSEYQPLTNSDLLYYRSGFEEMAGENEIFKIVSNGIGMETVTKQIQSIIANLGSSVEQQTGYFKTKTGNLIQGINDYANAIMDSQGDPYNKTIHDLYSSKQLTKTQAEQAQQAMVYIWQSLPENAKTLLKLKSDGTNEGAIKMIQSLISSKLNTTSEFSVKLEQTPEDDTKSSKDGKKNGFQMDPVSLLQAGYGQQQTITIQTKEGGNRGIQVPTVRMPIVKKTGESIGTSATLDDVTTSGFAGYLDFENAHMGGTKIPTVGFKNIAINGTALYTGYLPVDMQELYNSGRVKPDINLLERYKEAQEEIKRENITDKQEINKVYQDNKLPIMFDGNGDVLMNYRKFGMINATAIDNAFEQNAEFDDYLRETLDKNVIENALSIINKGEKNIDFESKGWFNSIGIGNYNHVYVGTIFIPVNGDHFTATAGFGNYPTDQEASMIEAKQQNLIRSEIAKQTYVNPGTL